VWRPSGFAVGCAAGGAVVRARPPRSIFGAYVFVAALTAGLVLAAGYTGGDMLLGA
jgi:hypothetical protein